MGHDGLGCNWPPLSVLFKIQSQGQTRSINNLTLGRQFNPYAVRSSAHHTINLTVVTQCNRHRLITAWYLKNLFSNAACAQEIKKVKTRNGFPDELIKRICIKHSTCEILTRLSLDQVSLDVLRPIFALECVNAVLDYLESPRFLNSL